MEKREERIVTDYKYIRTYIANDGTKFGENERRACEFYEKFDCDIHKIVDYIKENIVVYNADNWDKTGIIPDYAFCYVKENYEMPISNETFQILLYGRKNSNFIVFPNQKGLYQNIWREDYWGGTNSWHFEGNAEHIRFLKNMLDKMGV